MKKALSLLISLSSVLALSFIALPAQRAYADYANCDIEATVFDGNNIYITYGADAHIEPESTDTATVYADLYYGGERLDFTVGEGAAGGNYTYYNRPNGTYNFTVRGASQFQGHSGPGCENSTGVTVFVEETIYGCTDPAAKNYNPNANYNTGCEYEVYGCKDPAASNYNPSATIDDGSCEYPQSPPGDFYIYNTECFGWPSPQVENNFTSSSGADYYILQKYTSSWNTIMTGSYAQLDAFTDSSVSNGSTYYYRIIAENSAGSRISNEPGITVTQPNCGGGSITMSVSVAAGSGTISGTGISCPGDCSETYSYGAWSTVTATPASGYAFSSWSGACAGQGATCSVYMDSNRSASASFVSTTYPLTIDKSGTGSGTVTTSPAGISCGSTCAANFAAGSSVTITATPSAGSAFAGWLGVNCSAYGTSPCVVTMNAARGAEAVFNSVPFNYSLSNSGTSSATKSSGDVYTQNTVTKTLSAGATQSVSLSVSGLPSGVSYSVSNGTCSPTCSSTITFTIAPSAPAGSYTITVTGSPLSKTTSFTLSIAGSPMTVSCSRSPATALLGQSITWSSSITGGTSPFTYAWSGTNIDSPVPDTASFSKSYSTVGQKSAQVTVTDSDGLVATCPAATAVILFDPNFEEF